MNIQGLDLGWPQADFADVNAQAAVRAGIAFAFVGRQASNVNASRQRDALRAAGVVHIGEYLESPRGVWPELFPDTRLVAITVETDSGFETEADIDNALLFVRSQGRIPIIYSSAYMWHLLGLDAVTKYGEQGILLWDANYDGRCDGYALPVPFGGWMSCAIDQWSEHGAIEGYAVDLDECDDGIWPDVQAAMQQAAAAAWTATEPVAPALPSWVTELLAEQGEDYMGAMIQIKGSESITLTNDAITAALAPLVSGQNVPIHLLIGKNPDGTVRVVLDGIPLAAFPDIPELTEA